MPTWRKDILGGWRLHVGKFDVCIGAVYANKGGRWVCKAGDGLLDVRGPITSAEYARRLVETALELPACPVREDK